MVQGIKNDSECRWDVYVLWVAVRHHCQCAIVNPVFIGGTHTVHVCLFFVLSLSLSDLEGISIKSLLKKPSLTFGVSFIIWIPL